MSRRLLHSIQPKVSWKAMAVQGKTANDFAARLEATLNELADAGYGLALSFHRKEALILVGQKIEHPTSEELQRLLGDENVEITAGSTSDPSKMS